MGSYSEPDTTTPPAHGRRARASAGNAQKEAVPNDHLVRKIAAVLDLSWVHAELVPHYPDNGRPSIDPELMIRMLIIGYVFALRSERALCRDVQVNFALRSWRTNSTAVSTPVTLRTTCIGLPREATVSGGVVGPELDSLSAHGVPDPRWSQAISGA